MYSTILGKNNSIDYPTVAPRLSHVPTVAPSSAARGVSEHRPPSRPLADASSRASFGLGAAKHALQHGDLLLARRGLRVKVLLEVVDEREAGREGDGWLAVK